MIGRPIGLPWRNYMHVAQRQIQRHFNKQLPKTLEERSAFLKAEMATQSRLIREIALRHDRTAFGFCVVLAVRQGWQFRIFWLGDCRAYRIARGPDGFRCQALTRDHNALETTLREKGEMTLFRSEMMELGKQLDLHLGTDIDRVESALKTETTDILLNPGELLLFMTDGLYVPLIRVLMDRTNDRLSQQDLYLETLLKDWLDSQTSKTLSQPPWEKLIRGLVDDVERYTRQHRSYRDDIAVCGLHSPAVHSSEASHAFRGRLAPVIR